MKTLALTEPFSEELLKSLLKKYDLLSEYENESEYPEEDFFLTSSKYPIFAVADGVTLIQYLIEKKKYPNPSPAGEAAKVFCKELIKLAEEKYHAFKADDIKDIFREANNAVGKFNEENGRTKEAVDYWMNDFFAVTVAFAVIKDGVVYWGSIGTSYL